MFAASTFGFRFAAITSVIGDDFRCGSFSHALDIALDNWFFFIAVVALFRVTATAGFVGDSATAAATGVTALMTA